MAIILRDRNNAKDTTSLVMKVNLQTLYQSTLPLREPQWIKHLEDNIIQGGHYLTDTNNLQTSCKNTSKQVGK